jgi:hypothetical protein
MNFNEMLFLWFHGFAQLSYLLPIIIHHTLHPLFQPHSPPIPWLVNGKCTGRRAGPISSGPNNFGPGLAEGPKNIILLFLKMIHWLIFEKIVHFFTIIFHGLKNQNYIC